MNTITVIQQLKNKGCVRFEIGKMLIEIDHSSPVFVSKVFVTVDDKVHLLNTEHKSERGVATTISYLLEAGCLPIFE